jgi:YesN/AraC family two-component response regulator
MSNKYILVVEDDGVTSLYIKKCLVKEGYEVCNDYTDVDAAIRSIEKRKPDLVITDIKLHGTKSGIFLAQYLLELDTIPYIFITSYFNKIVLEKVKMVRPYAYLVKPIKSTELISNVYLAFNDFSHRNIDTNRSTIETYSDAPFQIKKAVDYISKNIENKIDVSDLASLTPWDNQHFIRIFKQHMNITPYQYILKRKIDLACVLLSETNDEIEKIAEGLGFINYSVFYKTFSKLTGSSPKIFRLNTKKNKT